MKQALVTGGTGFIGVYLANELQKQLAILKEASTTTTTSEESKTPTEIRDSQVKASHRISTRQVEARAAQIGAIEHYLKGNFSPEDMKNLSSPNLIEIFNRFGIEPTAEKPSMHAPHTLKT